MALPLEDNVSDIIGKAQRGLGFSDDDLSRLSGMHPDAITAIQEGREVEGYVIEKIAQALKLGPRALLAIAQGKYAPITRAPSPGFFMVNTAYGDMRVNAYLVWDPRTKLAAAFDTGGDAGPLVEEIQQQGLTLQDVYLTHAHGDHVAELDRLLEKVGGSVGVHVSHAEKLDGAVPFSPGVTFALGKLHIETRDTAGHSAGGTTYHVHGLDAPLSIVGDALFAGSVGGIRGDYPAALQRIRDNILAGQDNTVLAPGHGPLTTIVQERESNPFFPEFRRPIGQGI